MTYIPPILVFLATTFNGLLAILNAHGVKQTQATVILAEIMIVGASWAYAFSHYRPQMMRWMLFTAGIVVFAVIRAMVTDQPNVKFLRDILIIPTFILLGLSSDRRFLTRTVIVIQLFVMSVAVYEAVSPTGYGSLFGVQSYYINTRGYNDDNFWNKGSDLFVNAERPQDRIFLPQLDLHREASVFLEPVSLGNYCVVLMSFLCACFGSLKLREKLFLLFGTAFLIIACDGRIAFVTSIGIAGIAMLAPYLPRRLSLLTVPLVIAAAFLVVTTGHYEPGGDDFGGRLATTINLLMRFDIQDFFGISDDLVPQAADSGIAYLILTQSLFGALFIWMFLGCASAERTLSQIRLNHAIAFYLATALMVSFSVFTIKTAALLWYLFGTLQQPESRKAPAADVARGSRVLPRRWAPAWVRSV